MLSRSKLNCSKFWFVLSLIVLVVYFVMSLPLNFNGTNATTGNWGNYYNTAGLMNKDSDGYYKVSSASDLACLIGANAGLYTTSETKIRLTDNIDLGKHYWTPIKEFSGTFDGQGYTISNMWINYDATKFNSDAGFFGSIWGGTVKNVNFYNCGISKLCIPSHSIGIVAGAVGGGTIENCRVIVDSQICEIDTGNTKVIGFTNINSNTDLLFGGIVGWVKDSTIKGCHIDDTRITDQEDTKTFDFKDAFWGIYSNLPVPDDKKHNLPTCYIGSIVGMMEHTSEITLCSTNATINGIHKVNDAYVGGIAGYVGDGGKIKKSCNYGNITVGSTNTQISKVYVGGIVGYFEGTDVTNCFNMGNISGNTIESIQSIILMSDPNDPIVENSLYYDSEKHFDKIIDLNVDYAWKMYLNVYPATNKKAQGNPAGETLNKESQKINKGKMIFGGGIVGFANQTQIYSCYNVGDILENSIIETYDLNFKLIKKHVKYNNFYNPKEEQLSYIKAFGVQFKCERKTTGPIVGYFTNTIKTNYNAYVGAKIEEDDIKIVPEISTFQVKQSSENSDTYIVFQGTSNNDFPNSNIQVFSRQDTNYVNIEVILKTQYFWMKNPYESGDIKCNYIIYSSNVQYNNVYAKHFNQISDKALMLNELNKAYSYYCWATNTNINNGYPYIEEMYWNNNATEPSVELYEFDEDTKEAELKKVKFTFNVDILDIPETVSYNGYNYTVTKIAAEAFMNNNYIKNIILPDTVEEIGEYAFTQCKALKSIRLSKSLKTISKGMLKGCSNLENVKNLNSISVIEESAFEYCSSLKIIELSQKIKKIYRFAFMDCSSLEAIKLPSSLEYVESPIFYRCSKLSTVELEFNSKLEYMKSNVYHMFGECKLLEQITFNGTVEQWNASMWSKDAASFKDYTIICLNGDLKANPISSDEYEWVEA